MDHERAAAAPSAAVSGPLPPGAVQFAGEIVVANGKMPDWFTRVPHVAAALGLGYYLFVGAFDPVNLVVAALLIVWMIYTPIAQLRRWFFLPM